MKAHISRNKTNNQLFDITKEIISDINRSDITVSPFNTPSSPSLFYEFNERCKSKCAWNSDDSIGQHLRKLYRIIKKKTGLEWMTFMIQNPESTLTDETFTLYNIGIKDIKTRCKKWPAWFKDPNKFTFTNLFFVRRLNIMVYSKIFCLRIVRKNETSRIKPGDNLITFVVRVKADQSAAIENIYCDEKAVRAELLGHMAKIKEELSGGEEQFGRQLGDYVKNMEFFTDLHEHFKYLYAIPVIRSSYSANPIRSGLYLPSKQALREKTLQKLQEMITQPLCHVDYFRSEIRAARAADEIREKEQFLINTYHDVTRHVLSPEVTALGQSDIAYLHRKLGFMRRLATGTKFGSGELEEWDIAQLIADMQVKFPHVITFDCVGVQFKCWILRGGIETILENMIFNTIRHSVSNNKAKISISSNDGYVEITYADQGSGVKKMLPEKSGESDSKEKFANWRKGIFSEKDKGDELRGAGIYNIQLSVGFIKGKWDIIWCEKDLEHYGIEYKISIPTPYPPEWQNIIEEGIRRVPNNRLVKRKG